MCEAKNENQPNKFRNEMSFVGFCLAFNVLFVVVVSRQRKI